MAFPQYANKNDASVLSYIVFTALFEGWTVSVNDGEEWTLKRSSDYEAITAALMSTDSDYLVLRDVDGTKVGGIVTIYGNNGECIHDYSESDNDKFHTIMDVVEMRIDRFI